MIPLKDTIPSREKPFMTWFIIIVNVLIFLFQVSIPPEAAQEFVYRYGFIPEKFSRALSDGLITGIIYSIWPIICSMFMHGSLDAPYIQTCGRSGFLATMLKTEWDILGF